MKKYIILSLFWAMFLCAGCHCHAEKSECGSDLFCREQGEKITRAIIAGNCRDYLSAAGETEAIGDEKSFMDSRKGMLEKFGTPLRASFLTGLTAPLVTNHLWIFDFEKRISDGSVIPHQQLMQIVWGERDGKSVLLGMRFL